MPVFARQQIVGIDAQEVAGIGDDAAVEVFAHRGGVLLDQEAPIVLHLGEAVGDMLLQRVLAILEYQADFRSVERRRVEVLTAAGKGQVEALIGQDAIAQVEPYGTRFIGSDRDRHVEHVPLGPQRVLDLDVQREQAIQGWFDVQRRDVDGDAVEPIVHVLPTIAPRAVEHQVGRRGAILEGDQHVNQGQLDALILDLGPRRRRVRQGDHGLALVRRIAAGDEGVELIEVR